MKIKQLNHPFNESAELFLCILVFFFEAIDR